MKLKEFYELLREKMKLFYTSAVYSRLVEPLRESADKWKKAKAYKSISLSGRFMISGALMDSGRVTGMTSHPSLFPKWLKTNRTLFKSTNSYMRLNTFQKSTFTNIYDLSIIVFGHL